MTACKISGIYGGGFSVLLGALHSDRFPVLLASCGGHHVCGDGYCARSRRGLLHLYASLWGVHISLAEQLVHLHNAEGEKTGLSPAPVDTLIKVFWYLYITQN